jgi:deoxyribodipyrimidine photo-lyase
MKIDSKNKYPRTICWLRRDLRLRDHRALFEACRQSAQVIIAFVFDENILKKLNSKSDARVTYIHQSLLALDAKLRARGSALIWLAGDPASEIPKLAVKANCQAVFCNEDYESYAKTRDGKVAGTLRRHGIDFHRFKDQVLFSGSEVQKADGTPYRVFTPYKKIWLKHLTENFVHPFKPDLRHLVPKKHLGVPAAPLSLKAIGFAEAAPIISSGEKGAQISLRRFKVKLDQYAQTRDFPGLDSTSRMSVHLRFGTISIRACVRACWRSESRGAETWLNELIWRDFYQMILDRFPHVEKKAFVDKYESIKWPGKHRHLKAWREGRTGFPLVDAAMRQLNQTGFMHNRLRMVVASFLVKDLLVDWRKGEAYFAEKLLDYDKAANNGGWQWCASSGCDAQPYFRIFNPVSQSLRFDAHGNFIRKFVPELAQFSDRDIHFPALAKEKNIPRGFALGTDYPNPIVVHSQQVRRAVLLYRERK